MTRSEQSRERTPARGANTSTVHGWRRQVSKRWLRAHWTRGLLGVFALTMLPGISTCHTTCPGVDGEGNPIQVDCVQCSTPVAPPCMANVWDLPPGSTCLEEQRPFLPDGSTCDFAGEDDGVCVATLCEYHEFPCTEQGILDAIATGGGPQFFACNGPTTVTTQAEIVINRHVILDGEGNLTVSGNDTHRVFSVPEGVVAELRGFGITAGASNAGAGILNEGELTVANSTVSDNMTTGLPGSGGGILNNSATLTVVDSALLNNASDGGGGAIVSQGSASLMLTNSTVQSNSAGDAGGALWITGSAQVSGTAISQNQAQRGGGVWVSSGGNATISYGTVFGNTAIGHSNGGGGIGTEGTATLTLVNMTVAQNATLGLLASGGGILNDGGPLSLTNTTVSDNVTAGAGGGILNGGGGNITLTDCFVTNNVASDHGGGFWTNGAAQVDRTEITGNSANGGGGGWVTSGGSLIMADSTVSANDAVVEAGGIGNDFFGNTTITTTTISNNTASGPLGSGGGILNNSGTLTVVGSWILDNVSGGGGGILSQGAASLTLTNSNVQRNVASDAGGALWITGTANVSGNVISDNEANRGGGIWISSGGNVALLHGTVFGNSANARGGGIGMEGTATAALTNMRVEQNVVSGQSAPGGGIFNDGGPLTLIDTSVSNNQCNGSGGGILNDGGDTLTVSNSVISGNSGHDAGGGFWTNGTARVADTEILGNSAYRGGGLWITSGGSGIISNTTVSGGGIGSEGGLLTLASSTVVGNFAGTAGSAFSNHPAGSATMSSVLLAGTCDGEAPSSGGYNIESPGNTCGLTAPTDQTNVSTPQLNLGPLQDNGGDSQTHLPGAGSPAIDQIPAMLCLDADGAPLTTDQRGTTRPQGATCDIGAVEVEQP